MQTDKIKIDIPEVSLLINDIVEAVDRSKIGPLIIGKEEKSGAPIVGMLALHAFNTILGAALPRVIKAEANDDHQ